MSVWLEIAMGLSGIFLLFSTMCSAVVEGIAWVSELRSRTLFSGLERLLGTELRTKVLMHPLLSSLDSEGMRQRVDRVCPSYLHTPVFVSALLDTLQSQTPHDKAENNDWNAFLQSLAEQKDSPFQSVARKLRALIDRTATTAEQLRTQTAIWFDDAMRDLSGVYRRKTQLLTLAAAAVITLAFHLDSVQFVQSLRRDDLVRESVVALATKLSSTAPTSPSSTPNTTPTPLETLQDTAQQAAQLDLPLGWTCPVTDRGCSIGTRVVHGLSGTSLLGMLVSWIALALGAPFWFGVLNRFTNLRAVGRPPESASAPR